MAKVTTTLRCDNCDHGLVIMTVASKEKSIDISVSSCSVCSKSFGIGTVSTLRKLNIVKGTNPDRVAKHWLKYPEEWNAQYAMLLPDGITCANCKHEDRCNSMFDGKSTNKSCQFTPNRFTPNTSA